jgi:DNA replication and repair protein RecF
MQLVALRVRDFRVLGELELAGHPGVQLITGKNGAGKTSLIEAIYVAGRGESFRHREVRPWIRDGADRAQIFVRSVSGDGTSHWVGIEQTRNGREIRLDRETLKRRSDLARVLPLQLITPISHELIEKGPSGRRRFVDWGLFHVEPSFYRLALTYRRLLQQRNAALRGADPSYRAWDGQMAAAGESIERMRRDFLPRLGAYVCQELANFRQSSELTLRLRSNWDPERGLAQGLRDRRGDDEARGVSGVGPHRTSIDFLINGQPAERRLSRGQQKLLVYALFFGLSRLVKTETREPAIFLIDDLPAELDDENRTLVMQRLVELRVQAFVTGIAFEDHLFRMAAEVFHVEHGRLIS